MTQSSELVAASRTVRVHDVDALRGFALLGIFVVNITFMASAYPGNLVDDPSFSSPIDSVARFLVAVLFSMKFYLLFSFLFGYSFVLQMDASARAGAAFVPRMLRRSLGLFIFGAGHIVLLYSGDVLTTYAVICLVLLAIHHVRDRTALLTGAIIYACVTLSLVISAAFLDRSMFMPSHKVALEQAATQTQAMLGGPIEVLGHHLGGLDLLVIQAASLQGPTALAMFLIGMVAARHRLFSDLGDKPELLQRIQLVGFAVGLPGGVLFAWLGGDTNTWATAVSVVTAPFLSAAYVATLIRLLHARRGGWLRRVLEPVGRIALTNYLAQSLVGLLLFTGIGIGLAGRVSPPFLFVLAVVIFAAQAAVSAGWLRTHRYGPAEYLLRLFTNWSPPRRSRTEVKPRE
ncbi:MAG TPA: DUF418 domain-containing protein [Brevibacterium senegalense]|uniref:DUF418 domain-containing protein n=1 Tax=Brevibacterium senegalense TaxID=1033736 RepID=A0A921SNP5_9MICO|nr:DUF418 domain-containing protein [Brevibacterium senegalense]